MVCGSKTQQFRRLLGCVAEQVDHALMLPTSRRRVWTTCELKKSTTQSIKYFHKQSVSIFLQAWAYLLTLDNLTSIKDARKTRASRLERSKEGLLAERRNVRTRLERRSSSPSRSNGAGTADGRGMRESQSRGRREAVPGTFWMRTGIKN